MSRCHAWRAILAAVLAAVSGCDCQGSGVGEDADVQMGGDDGVVDLPPDSRDAWDADAGGDGEIGPDGGDDTVDDAVYEAEAWPDAPVACEWYELRSEFDDPCPGGDSWVRDPFYAPGDEPVLRLVSVYRASSAHGASGVLTVRLRRTYRPVVLVLGSNESVTWNIEREDGARLERIYVYSYDEQFVTGADDVPLTDHSTTGPYLGTCYPFCGEHDTRPAVAMIEAETGLTLRSFDGCDEARGITLGDVCREECRASVACTGRECGGVPECRLDCGACDPGTRCDGFTCLGCTPSCAGRECGTDGCGGSCGFCPDGLICDTFGACIPATTFPGCADIVAESHYCVTLSDGRPALLGLDSGNICPFGKPDLDLGGAVSIGWADGNLFICVDRPGLRGLGRYTVLADSLAVAPVPCEAVAAWRGGLISAEYMAWHPPYGLQHFTSFDDALDGVGETWSWGLRGTAMTTRDDFLYSSRGAGSELRVLALPSGETVRTITMEGFDARILGMSVTDDGILVLNSGFAEGRVAMFDDATGAWLRDVTPSGPVGPLACFVGP